MCVCTVRVYTLHMGWMQKANFPQVKIKLLHSEIIFKLVLNWPSADLVWKQPTAYGLCKKRKTKFLPLRSQKLSEANILLLFAQAKL